MPFRFVLAACLVAPLLVNPVLAKDTVAGAKEPSVTQTAARERQKKCGAEWRALSVADKAAKGPKWPQYFSKCVKRLKSATNQ
jgi:hypothetical protein